jgi:starch phosphorylase
MRSNNVSFETALMATRAGNLFTTHTAVPAGFDRYPPEMIERYLGNYIKTRLNISLQQLLALGRKNSDDANEPFNMAYLALRGSGASNGVSRLHGKVSRQLFSHLYPRWPEEEVPIGYVTNGVHVPSWASVEASQFWEHRCGKNCWSGTPIEEKASVHHLPDAVLWRTRNDQRTALVEFCRERLSRILEARTAAADWIELAKHIFDPNILTIGFARRFATYKRPNLLLHDSERLLRLLKNQQMPVQLVIAGKAHPADRGGQALIQQWMHFIMRAEVRPHVIFLEDYDMLVTEQMVRGVDLWVNTPRRPWEACGTSGMKVLCNGGLNLSELDGWWAEAYSPKIGWALGDGLEHGDDPAVDAADANQLYDLLENEVAPSFYQRNAEGIPTRWVALMRESMARLTPEFSADRAVRQYTEQYYLPGAKAYRERSKDKGALAQRILETNKKIMDNWCEVRFGNMQSAANGDKLTIELQLYLDGVDPEQLSVELYAEGLNGTDSEKIKMDCAAALTSAKGLYLYRATVPAVRPASDYTARVLPVIPGAQIPLEFSEILWQK